MIELTVLACVVVVCVTVMHWRALSCAKQTNGENTRAAYRQQIALFALLERMTEKAGTRTRDKRDLAELHAQERIHKDKLASNEEVTAIRENAKASKPATKPRTLVSVSPDEGAPYS